MQHPSWGGMHGSHNCRIARPRSTVEVLDQVTDFPVLAIGNGRSYGDVGTLDNGLLIDMRGMNRILAFDTETGIGRFQAGMLLGQVLDFGIPRGWLLPTTPGTQFVSLGGAVANDVHGKNHHSAGSFGCHVVAMAIARSDGRLVHCSRKKNPCLFLASIGGLGMTGTIVWVDLALKKAQGECLDVETRRYGSLDDYFRLADTSTAYDCTVAWVDCSARGAKLGRGIFQRANHRAQPCQRHTVSLPAMSLIPNVSLVNQYTIRAFNQAYYYWTPRAWKHEIQTYRKFNYPLDGIPHWNRMYGRNGFYQFQNVVPVDRAYNAMVMILKEIALSRQGSFLVVLKSLGSRSSGGYLSFPRPGVTLAIDFPNLGDRTLRLLKKLEAITVDNDGALYPAKDAIMEASTFRRLANDWSRFEQERDVNYHSSFWERVNGA